MGRETIVMILRYLFLFNCLRQVLAIKYCWRVDDCTCGTDEGQIDLHKLGKKDGTARFPHIPSDDKEFLEFSWNPCYPYTTSDSCEEVEACAVSKSHKSYALSSQDPVKCDFSEEEERCSLVYEGQSIDWKGVSRKSSLTVSLSCFDHPGVGEVEGIKVQHPASESSTIKFETIFHSKYACPGKQPTSTSETTISTVESTDGHSTNTPDNPSGLSLGSILLIIFFSLMVAYIIFGALYNKFARSREGKEVFPHYTFWIELPLLVKEGGAYSFHSVKKLCGRGSDGGYARI